FEFQSQVAELTGMEVANASMYDGSTAAGEAVLMAHRVTRRNHAVVSGRVHPQYVDVIVNLSDMGSFGLTHIPPTVQGAEDLLSSVDENTSCLVVQNPDFFGSVNDYTELAEAVHARGALLVVVVTEAVSLGVLKTPGTMGADIVVGEGQSRGNGLNFGGPYVGLFAAREKFLRQMPGRLCGETVDADGKRGFVLTLSTREQHIRRDKATSNICTNSGLCSLAFSAHLSLLGGSGLQHLAWLNHEQAVDLAGRLGSIDGVKPINDTFFNEFTVELPQPADTVVEALAARGVLGGVPVSRLIPDGGFENYLLVAATETCAPEDMAAYAAALEEVLS
ncbi:MAG: aminomethyl-transferring glycine dehydrogenase subunit GcvPA, partial [Pseudomonadota bacterium]|nr:aminomethyl-transferring glycine dehydrogenase subunit GcvPA [Pseudomonadota bacterium]